MLDGGLFDMTQAGQISSCQLKASLYNNILKGFEISKDKISFENSIVKVGVEKREL